ncbi:serine hydrolase [Pseudoalteromonas luteoviolacea]|uniref:Tail specific protease domain-containing protein n=1 Tax=Pseudoalteromonas luteoviolacea DSM 6061 TaxID=1365250 RepID=A0A162A3D1_9GAMM|nr:serine hydrolase [Pseudoalteromonas luteoviolacea]KZN43520.1 hypothetical protein N475_08945 [Pseudoalteromonas luteoviolacea DSM 6061]MBE0388047.1 hypothetical protein [Pseudoalteromonas luteoviolacea DSM 6061]
MRLISGYTSILTAALLLLSGCQDNQDHRSDLQRSAGFWQKPAYGEALNITMNRVVRYQYNRYGCIQVSEQQHSGMTAQLDSVALSNTRRLRVAPKGQVYPSYYTQLDTLPDHCNNPIAISDSAAPDVIFDYFWHTFNDYYAFFSLRDVDWQAQYDLYRPMVHNSMSDEALFSLLSDMVAPLQDMHVTLSSHQQDYFSSKPTPILQAIQNELDFRIYQGQDSDLQSLYQHYQKQMQRVSSHYIAPDSLNTLPQGSDNATAIWGVTASNVGILVINNMNFFDSDKAADETQHLEAAHKMMADAMADLKDSEAMIIDIRHNTGGDDAISLAVASYFADRELLAFNKQAINQVGRGIPLRQKLSARQTAYTKPVYLLTSQLTVSAAEVFTMAMDQLDHVTKVGEETAGALSDALRFSLPNGWQFSLSNEVYRNAQGNSFEHIGFIPDHHVPAFSLHDIEMKRFSTYDFVLNKLNKPPKPNMTIDEFEHQVRELQTHGNITKVAVSIISQGQTVYSHGFTTEAQHPVNADTPFYLASLDETLIGATIAAASSESHLALDQPIEHLLPFPLAYPSGQSNALTLIQLLTHTSGIVDNRAIFDCILTLSQINTRQAVTCADTKLSRGDFLAAYLSAEGELYHTGNFSSQYGLEPGTSAIYSQVGVELATFVIEQASQSSISELAQRHLFEPLNMHNTRFQTLSTKAQAKSELISTANDLSYFLAASMQPTYALPTPLSRYFWLTDNKQSYQRGSGAASRTHLYADVYSQTGFVLLTDANPDSEASNEAYKQLEQLVFNMAEQLNREFQQRISLRGK